MTIVTALFCSGRCLPPPRLRRTAALSRPCRGPGMAPGTRGILRTRSLGWRRPVLGHRRHPPQLMTAAVLHHPRPCRRGRPQGHPGPARARQHRAHRRHLHIGASPSRHRQRRSRRPPSSAPPPSTHPATRTDAASPRFARQTIDVGLIPDPGPPCPQHPARRSTSPAIHTGQDGWAVGGSNPEPAGKSGLLRCRVSPTGVAGCCLGWSARRSRISLSGWCHLLLARA